MKKGKGLSIRKKLLINMVIFSVVLITFITSTALYMTYNTMREQLIYNRRTSATWLQERMRLDVQESMSMFYELETNREIKENIREWCAQGDKLDYIRKDKIRLAVNSIISMNSSINSIEIYSMEQDLVWCIQRKDHYTDEIGERLALWNARSDQLQTNLVFMREGKEIVAYHRMNRFENNRPYALVAIRMRPYNIQDILEDIKMAEDESIILINDDFQIIEGNYGREIEEKEIVEICRELSLSDTNELRRDGNLWFYRSVNGGKYQVLLTVPTRTIISALSGTLLAGVIAAIIAVLASVGGSVLFSRVFSRPITELSEQMRTITLDDYTGGQTVTRQDEIGVLQDSFEIMIERNQDLIAREYQSKLEKREAQIRALQAQINPHFMYNTLQVIGGMALRKEAPEIYNVTIALSDIMRYSLNFKTELVCIQEEIRYLKGYLEIQNERFGNRIELKVEIDDEIGDCLIPKLILQPLLENSFEHGLAEKTGNWEIRLIGRITEEGDLLLTVSDNGTGIPDDRLKEIRDKLAKDAAQALGYGSHIGLSNVDSRIRLLHNDERYGVTILSAPDKGTAVQIRMKVLREGEHNGEI